MGMFKTTEQELAKGREYWEDQYSAILGSQELFIDTVLNQIGLPNIPVARDMIANMHLEFCTEFRQWIEHNFKNSAK